jgi:hypothetical protein
MGRHWTLTGGMPLVVEMLVWDYLKLGRIRLVRTSQGTDLALNRLYAALSPPGNWTPGSTGALSIRTCTAAVRSKHSARPDARKT